MQRRLELVFQGITILILNFFKILQNIISTPYALLLSMRLTPFDFRHLYFFSINKKKTEKWILILFFLLIINSIYCYINFQYLNLKLYINFFLPFLYLPSINKFFESNNALKFVYNSCLIHSIMQLIDIFTSNNLQESSNFYLDSNFFGLATNSTFLAYLICSTLSFNKYSINIFKMKSHFIIVLSTFINLYYCIAAETFYNLIISIILIIFIIPLPYKGYRKILFNILTLNLNPINFIKKFIILN